MQSGAAEPSRHLTIQYFLKFKVWDILWGVQLHTQNGDTAATCISFKISEYVPVCNVLCSLKLEEAEKLFPHTPHLQQIFFCHDMNFKNKLV